MEGLAELSSALDTVKPNRGTISSMLRALVVLQAVSAVMYGCGVLDLTRPQSLPVSGGCATVSISRPTQLLISQPVDLSILVAKEGLNHSVVYDSFEFGRETIAIVSPGVYRIGLRPVSAAPVLREASISSRSMAEPVAARWMTAELAGAKAKLSRDDADVLAGVAAWKLTLDNLSIARAFLTAGALSAERGRPAEDLERNEEALRYCRLAADPRCAAEAANNGGLAAMHLGRFDLAMKRFTEARKDWRLSAEPALEAFTISNLGLLHRRMGNLTQAIAHYSQARLRIPSADVVAQSRIVNNIGMCYLAMGQPREARRQFESALPGLRQSKSKRDAILAQSNLGRAYLLERRLPQAAAVLEAARIEAKQANDKLGSADVLLNLGQTFLEQQQTKAANDVLMEALALARETKARREYAGAQHYLGVIAAKQGNFSSAIAHLAEAAQARMAVGLRDAAVESLVELAKVEFSAHKSADAIRHAEQAGDLAESIRSSVPGTSMRSSYVAMRRPLFDLLVEIKAGATEDPKGNAVSAFLASDRGKGRAVLDTLAERRIIQSLTPALYERRTKVRRELDFLLSQLPSDPEKDPAGLSLRPAGLSLRIDALHRQDEELRAEIDSQAKTLALGRPLDSLQELQQTLLSSNDAILAFHLGERVGFLWLITRDVVRMFPLSPREEIENSVLAWTRLFERPLERRRNPKLQLAFDEATRRLSAQILSPLAGAKLPPHLILVPDGVLHAVPFAALLVDGPGAPVRLGLRHSISVAPSAAFLVSGSAPKPASAYRKTVLAIVDPVFSASDPRLASARGTASPSGQTNRESGLARLPFSAEIDEIAAHVPASLRTVLRGFDADLSQLQRLPLSEYRLIHFSSHAIIDSEMPEMSRVILSMFDRNGKAVNGVLHPRQLAGMRFDRSIVVISACETAKGKAVVGEGFSGFASSLFHAGASQLVLTTARVDAESASEFLRETYKQLLGANSLGMEEAMQHARITLASSRRWADPYYWASFTLAGRGR